MCKCIDEPLKMSKLTNRISMYRKLEENYARKQNNMYKFNLKWSIYDKV